MFFYHQFVSVVKTCLAPHDLRDVVFHLRDPEPLLEPMDLMETQCCESPKSLGSCCSTPTMLETLKDKKARLQLQMNDVDKAIAALESSPGIEQLLEAIRRCNRI